MTREHGQRCGDGCGSRGVGRMKESKRGKIRATGIE